MACFTHYLLCLGLIELINSVSLHFSLYLKKFSSYLFIYFYCSTLGHCLWNGYIKLFNIISQFTDFCGFCFFINFIWIDFIAVLFQTHYFFIFFYNIVNPVWCLINFRQCSLYLQKFNISLFNIFIVYIYYAFL